MPINKIYHPNYHKLYPSAELTPDVLSALNKSDRKMEYMEYELKHSRARKSNTGEVVSVMPPREDSFERLEETNQQFSDSMPSPEDVFFKFEEQRELYRCLDLLDKDERFL